MRSGSRHGCRTVRSDVETSHLDPSVSSSGAAIIHATVQIDGVEGKCRPEAIVAEQNQSFRDGSRLTITAKGCWANCILSVQQQQTSFTVNHRLGNYTEYQIYDQATQSIHPVRGSRSRKANQVGRVRWEQPNADLHAFKYASSDDVA